LTVDPSLSDGIRCLLLRETQHFRDHRSRCDFDENNMVQANLVERVLQSQTSLNLVRFDHALQNVLDLEDFPIPKLSASTICSGYPVRDSKDSTKVIRRMTPFSGKPTIVIVQPTNHGTNVKRAIDRVKLIRGTKYPSAVRDRSTLHNRTQELGAFFEAECFQTAAKGIQKYKAGSVILGLTVNTVDQSSRMKLKVFPLAYSKLRVDLAVVDVAGHVLNFRVVFPRACWRRGGGVQCWHG